MLIRRFLGFELFLGIFLGLSQAACAHRAAKLLRGDDISVEVSVAQVVADVPRGSILILGENHGLAVHRDQHLEILNTLRAAGHSVSVGMEFFSYPSQADVHQWRAGALTESEFLKVIGWGTGLSFDFYRPQSEFPRIAEGERTIALNAPRSLTSKIAKTGLDSLTSEERAQLPPSFTRGRDFYRLRFESNLSHLPEGEAKQRYFTAQSVWDDTMAWTASEFQRQHPEQTLVIIVGEFHVQYGGGLPDRLRARGARSVRTLSQINTSGLSPEEIQEELKPHVSEGPRADWLWTADASPETR